MKPLGVGLERTEWELMHGVCRDVIGAIEVTGAGNVLLRVGQEIEPGGDWTQIGHVVLGPDEIEVLCNELAVRIQR